MIATPEISTLRKQPIASPPICLRRRFVFAFPLVSLSAFGEKTYGVLCQRQMNRNREAQ